MLTDDQQAFVEHYFKEMYEIMVYYANCDLKSNSLSEEAVQETFRIACGKIDKFSNSANPKGWLMNTLKFVLRNIVKHQQILKKHLLLSIDIDSIQVESFDELSLESLYGNVADSADFMLLKRIAIDGCSILEAAVELGISIDACKKRVQRAKKKLREKIE